MTRKVVLATVVLLSIPGTAFAIDPTSTMADWKTASAAEREALLDALGPSLSPSFKADRAAILACLDRTAQTDAHEDLPIREVVGACVSIVNAHQSPNPADEI